MHNFLYTTAVVRGYLDRADGALGNTFDLFLDRVNLYLSELTAPTPLITRAQIVSRLPANDSFLMDNLTAFLIAAGTLRGREARGRSFYSFWYDEQAPLPPVPAVQQPDILNNAAGSADSSLSSNRTNAESRNSHGGSRGEDEDSSRLGGSVMAAAEMSLLDGVTLSSGSAGDGGIEAVLEPSAVVVPAPLAAAVPPPVVPPAVPPPPVAAAVVGVDNNDGATDGQASATRNPHPGTTDDAQPSNKRPRSTE